MIAIIQLININNAFPFSFFLTSSCLFVYLSASGPLPSNPCPKTCPFVGFPNIFNSHWVQSRNVNVMNPWKSLYSKVQGVGCLGPAKIFYKKCLRRFGNLLGLGVMKYPGDRTGSRRSCIPDLVYQYELYEASRTPSMGQRSSLPSFIHVL